MAKTAVAVAEKTALAEQSPLLGMYENEAGAGFENADAQSYAIPFLSILQAMSPQCKRSDGAYIQGAQEGMLLNTVTQEIFDGDAGVEVIPCYYRRTFIRWAPRESGGGFKGEFLPSDPLVAKATNGKAGNELPDGDRLVDTRIHYVLVLKEDGNFSPAVISLSSTQVKKSRQWMSKMENIKFKNSRGEYYTPPMFSHVYKLSTVPEQNEHGSWYGLKVETVRVQDDPVLFNAAKKFKQQVEAGEIKEQPHTEANSSTQPADDDIPF